MMASVPRVRLIILGLGIAFLSTAGCGSNPNVEGIVTYKGVPVEGAMVTYLSDDGTAAGAGATDASGKYRLKTTQGKDGVPAGNYTVTVSKSSTTGGSEVIKPEDSVNMMKDMMKKGKAATKSVLPSQFAQKATSTLKKTVPSGDYNLDLGS